LALILLAGVIIALRSDPAPVAARP
jgi:hypothetical protein